MIEIDTSNINNAELLLKTAKYLSALYERLNAELPYKFNIITELHANENANTRILCGLLMYKVQGDYPLLKKFLEQIHLQLDCKIIDPVFSVEEITDNARRIDLLIMEEHKYGIIVENKIWNAADQEKQIEDYINYVSKKGVPRNSIYVIYLTGDGTKEVSETSLTKEAKRFLHKTSKSDGRFIPMNFKYDVVSWLESISTLDCVHNELLLRSAIAQYMDFLKDTYDLYEDDIRIDNKLENDMAEKLQLNDLTETLKAKEEVNKLQEVLSESIDKQIKSMMESKIVKPLERKGYKIKTYDFSHGYFDLEIEIDEWKKSWWSMESDKTGVFWGIWNGPDNRIAKKYLDKMKDIYDNTQEKGYVGWNFYEYKKELNDEFWTDIEQNSSKHVKNIVAEIERVRKSAKDMRL